MAEDNFRKICITLRADQVKDLKSRSRNVSRIIRDAIDYYLTLDIGSSDIAIYEIRRDVKKLLSAMDLPDALGEAPKEKPPAKKRDDDMSPLASIIKDEKDEKIVRLMRDRGHENTKNLVEELSYSRTESVRDKLNSLNKRAQDEFGRPLFRYFRSRDGFDYSWWMILDPEELSES
jgi:hypothetical protein